MSATREFPVHAKSAVAFPVEAGEVLRIIDEEGGQPGDLVAFSAGDPKVALSQARTRVENRSVRVTTGHGLWTNTLPPRAMLTITADTCGVHDLLYTPCCRYALQTRFATSGDGCYEHLAAALAEAGLRNVAVPDPLSLFFRVDVGPDGALAIGEPPSHPGDYIELRAEMDCIVAVSTCAVPLPGRRHSGYLIRVGRPPLANP